MSMLMSRESDNFRSKMATNNDNDNNAAMVLSSLRSRCLRQCQCQLDLDNLASNDFVKGSEWMNTILRV